MESVKPELETEEIDDKKEVNDASDQIMSEEPTNEIASSQPILTSSEKPTREKQYYVICNMNTPEQEDFIFIFNALFHWYLRYPNKSIKLVEDPSEICQVAKAQTVVQAKPEEEKKDDQKLEPSKEKEKLPEIIEQDKVELVKHLKEMFKDEQAVEDLKAAEEMLKSAAIEHLQDELSLSDLAPFYEQ